MNKISRSWISGCSLLALLYADSAIAVETSFKQENILNTNETSAPNSAEVNSTSEEEIYNENNNSSDVKWLSDEDASYSNANPSDAPLTQENLKDRRKTTFVNESYVRSDSDSDSSSSSSSNSLSSSSSRRYQTKRTTPANKPYYSDSDSDSSFDSLDVSEIQKAPRDLLKRIKRKDKEGIKKILISNDALNKWNDKGQPALVMYARNGDLKMIKWLMENFKEHLNINVKDFKGDTALIDAAFKGHYDIVKYLVENGADINVQGEYGNTALINSIWDEKRNKITHFLLDQPGIELDLKGQQGKTALFRAVDTENTEMVERLVNMKADPNIADDQGNTPLMIAVKKGYIEILKLLLALPNHFNTDKIKPLLYAYKNKQRLDRSQITANYKQMVWVDVNAKNNNGDTALLLAVNNKNLEIMNLLLEHGAKIDSGNRDFANMLEWAVKRKEDASFDTVKRLLQFRKNFDDQPFSDPKFGRDLLECAIEQGDFDKAWLLIEKGEDLNGLKEKFKNNALYKDLQRIYLALKSKTNVNIKDENGYTALLSVLKDERIRRVSYDLVKRLLESGANVNASSGRGITALHLAVLQGYAEIAELLIEHGANVNASDDNGDTALLSVLKNKRILVILLMHDLVKLLLKFDADVKASNDRGITALHLAAQEGYAEIAELLIKHGANVNAESEDGRTPLFFAENVKTAKLLIEHGADIYWKNRNGDTALLSVLKNERIQIEKYYLVKRLLKSGADVNASNRGITALHLAAQKGYVEIAELLIKKYRANVNASDDNGNTALLFAFNNKNLEIMNLLLDHGAKIDSINVVFPNMLKWAVESKDDASFDTVKRLLRFRKNFDDKSFIDPEFGRELLECVIKQKDFDKAWLLIEKGADLNGLKRKYEHNAWYKYLQRIYSVVKSETNVDIKDENGNTVLQSVLKDKKIRRVKYDLVERLLESGVDVNVSDGKKNTALHLAVREGYTGIAELLIKHRANINAVNEDGWTPLFFAEDVETAQLLVDHGAKVDWKIKDGRNWLVKYLSFGEEIPPEQKKLPMVEFILKKLSRDGINEPNDLGDTALHVTARCNYAKITELLINYGADIHLRNKEGETPLIYTAKYDSEKVARVLLNMNENTEKAPGIKKIPLEEVNEALMIAAENGNEKIVELLLDTRSDISEKQIRNALEKAKEKGGANYLSGYGYRFGKTIEILSERIPESDPSASSSDSDSSSSTSPKRKREIIIMENLDFSSSDSDDEPYYLNKSRSNSQETQESSSSSSDNDDDRDTSDSDSSSSTSPKRKREIIIMENLDSSSSDSDDEPYYLNKSRSNSQETQESSSSSSDSETKSHIVYKTKNKGKKPASTNSDSYFSSDY